MCLNVGTVHEEEEEEEGGKGKEEKVIKWRVSEPSPSLSYLPPFRIYMRKCKNE